MIKYPEGAFGFQILFRLHGSAVFKSIMPALISSAIYLIMYHTTDLNVDGNEIMDHPYPIGALVAAFTFLLSFRANFAYNRYWEAFTAVHQMHSKWLDVGMDLAAFHLQSSRYNNIKPPSFGHHPHLTSIERERERINEPTREEIELQIDETLELKQKQELEQQQKKKKRGIANRLGFFVRRRRHNTNTTPGSNNNSNNNNNNNNNDNYDKNATSTPISNANTNTNVNAHHTKATITKFIPVPRRPHKKDNNKMNATKQSTVLDQRIRQTRKNINGPPSKPFTSLPGGIRASIPQKQATLPHTKKTHRRVVSSVSCVTAPSTPHEDHPDVIDERPLFLQEVAHLLSLLSAVALSTLRNDLEHAESPLITFTPGAPFPAADPDSMTADIREGWEDYTEQVWFPTLRFLFGLSRNEAGRALYNAARPFRVIGGVSDNEVLLLQAARGPQAKVNLVSLWVTEFISREYLAGSTGNVGPPILSRLYQFSSDGNLGYNQARKVAYIPFPFAHAQITCLFVLVIVAIIPILMLTFVSSEAFGFLLNLLTVMCFAGLHEVSRELENPFQNAPNDLPANNLHAQYNEALMTMFAGYHPDAYWEVKETEITEPEDTSCPDLPLDSIDFGALVAGLQRGEEDELLLGIERDSQQLHGELSKIDDSLILDMADLTETAQSGEASIHHLYDV